jgi:hypothetical protein
MKSKSRDRESRLFQISVFSSLSLTARAASVATGTLLVYHGGCCHG